MRCAARGARPYLPGDSITEAMRGTQFGEHYDELSARRNVFERWFPLHEVGPGPSPPPSKSPVPSPSSPVPSPQSPCFVLIPFTVPGSVSPKPVYL